MLPLWPNEWRAFSLRRSQILGTNRNRFRTQRKFVRARACTSALSRGRAHNCSRSASFRPYFFLDQRVSSLRRVIRSLAANAMTHQEKSRIRTVTLTLRPRSTIDCIIYIPGRERERDTRLTERFLKASSSSSCNNAGRIIAEEFVKIEKEDIISGCYIRQEGFRQTFMLFHNSCAHMWNSTGS